MEPLSSALPPVGMDPGEHATTRREQVRAAAARTSCPIPTASENDEGGIAAGLGAAAAHAGRQDLLPSDRHGGVSSCNVWLWNAQVLWGDRPRDATRVGGQAAAVRRPAAALCWMGAQGMPGGWTLLACL